MADALRRHRAGDLQSLTCGPFLAAGLAGGGVDGDAVWISPRGDLCVVAHARLLNGHPDDLHPDPPNAAARVAVAWRRCGEDAVSHLVGDFAFVVWDAVRGILFAARDPAAARPLVYADVGGDLLFASDPAALLADAAVSRHPDLRCLADFLALDLYPDGRTPWAAVRKLPPGHRLTCKPGGPVRVERWWRPETLERLAYRHDEDYVEHFAALLRTTTGERLAAAGRRGAVLLSGGVDSSSVAALMAEAHRGGVTREAPVAVSHVFPTFPPCDESRHAESVARHAGMALLPVSAERPLATGGVPDPGRADREPWVQGQLELAAPLVARAAEAGAAALLTGFGGDSLFDAARWRFFDDVRSGRWVRLGPWIRARREAGAGWPGALAAVVVKPLLPRAWLSFADRRRGTWHRRQIPPWLPPALVRATGLAQRLTARRLPRSLPGVRQLQLEQVIGLAQQTAALEGLEQLAARRGVEVFHPLLDRRVAELVLAAPLRLGARPGAAGSKWLLRAAVGDLLPSAVRRRDDKTGWGPYLAHLLRGEGGHEMLALFRHSRSGELGLVDDRVLCRELARFRRGEGPYGHGLHFLPPLWVELWLRAGGAG